ncbi:MAG: stage II sporulation protein M, partial [Candidatus Woesearchaeota archaeon]
TPQINHMVLESLINPLKAERKPVHMLFFGALYASVAVFLSLWIFKEEASMIVVFLTVLATVPLMYRTIRYEEEKDLKIKDETTILKEHGRALEFFMFLFMGCVIGFVIWFVFLPHALVQELFSTQLFTINVINNKVTGDVVSSDIFFNIISNNFKVMFFCLFFSFFYGAGAIFILTWNASVIASAIGTYIRTNIALYAEHAGYYKVAGYFQVVSVGLFRYMTHGVFEILAYFIAGLAGGLISVAIIRHNIGDKQFNKVFLDSMILLIIAALVTVFAGFVEVYITPSLF